MRIARLCIALIAALSVASCASGDEGVSSSSTLRSPTTTVDGRGATAARIGEPVERADGAYKITLEGVVDPGDCASSSTARSSSDTNDRLLVARFVFETSGIPLDGEFLATTDFYTVTEQTVRTTPNIDGKFQCENGIEGRAATNDPLPNARILRTETLLVPSEAQLLGYRDPDTREAFEWNIAGVPTAPSQAAPTVLPPPTTVPPTTAPQPPADATPTSGPVVTSPTTAVAPTSESCVEGTTRYSPNSGITYTCRNGSWREGPYN